MAIMWLDWNCSACGEVNHGSKDRCTACGHPKDAAAINGAGTSTRLRDLEREVGAGGGDRVGAGVDLRSDKQCRGCGATSVAGAAACGSCGMPFEGHEAERVVRERDAESLRQRGAVGVKEALVVPSAPVVDGGGGMGGVVPDSGRDGSMTFAPDASDTDASDTGPSSTSGGNAGGTVGRVQNSVNSLPSRRRTERTGEGERDGGDGGDGLYGVQSHSRGWWDEWRGVVYAVLGVAGVGGCIAGMVWLSEAHAVVGRVAEVRWNRVVEVEAWRMSTVREWKHRAVEQKMVAPVGGVGGVGGFEAAGGCMSEKYEEHERSCRQESSGGDCCDDGWRDEVDCRNVTKTESYTSTCERSEPYKTGTSCRQIAGKTAAECHDTYDTRTVTEVCIKTRQVFDYRKCECTQYEYRPRCSYNTWSWQDVRSVPASGVNNKPYWPEPVYASLERFGGREEMYGLDVSYQSESIWGRKPSIVTRSLPDVASYEGWLQVQQAGSPVMVTESRIGVVYEIAAEGVRLK